VAALLAILAVAGGVAFAQSQREAPSHPVPSLVGHSQAEAAGLLGPLHLRMVVVGRSYDPKAVAGTVTSQQPSTGTLREGEAVKVTLSLGPQPVPVPSLASLTKDEATSVLHTLGLAVGQVSSEASLTVAAGQVIRYDPSQGSLLPGQTVNLVVSSGKPTVAVPALGGPQVASFAAAKAVLAAANLVASEVDQHSDTVAKGQVMGTQPLAGTVVTVQSSVTVVVSLGPDLVAVPAVHGMSVPAASQALSAAGFHVSGVSGDPTATVSDTNPPAGALIHRGASVQLITQ